MTTLTLRIKTSGQGLQNITDDVQQALNNAEMPGSGLCTLFIQHTSASLIIQESYDPSAKRDLEAWLNRLVPERDKLYTHTLEGDDDMPAHIKSVLTATSLSIPIIDSQLGLGTWQGIYLWEHRHQSHQRTLLISIL